jgi:hypothetical protein
VAASCRTGRKDRTQLHDALLSRGPIAKTGATSRSVRKSFRSALRASTLPTLIWFFADTLTFSRNLTNGLRATVFEVSGA